MIHSPTTFDDLGSIDDLATGDAVVRAGGTDLQERLRSHNAAPTLVDLGGIGELRQIARSENGWTIGAGATIAVVAREAADDYPALAITAGGLATPQVRAHGTIGGNLTQHTRCWYYRHPGISCFKSGGDTCPARDGRHLYGVVFDRSDCVHPHPSSIAMALLTYDATINTTDGTTRTIDDLLGDGTDATRDHQLPNGAVIASVGLPTPWPDERAAYFRSISRFEAEWPLVECVVRARLDGEVVTHCRLAIGGVATVPMRMDDAASSLVGSPLTDEHIARVAAACTTGASPLPETGYKVALTAATVRETLERLRAS
ncbi:MAG: FAD binding domain-containing protein [Actinomycetota bacterium]